jgi:DNA repair protein RecO (recombination protein O)
VKNIGIKKTTQSNTHIDFQSAYVLHTRPYQETSLLLELLTPEQGRFGAIAKGAKRPKSPARGLLQPFTPLLISCKGKGELLTLTQVDGQGRVHHLFAKRLISAFYVNELLMRLLNRWDAHEALFFHYQETLIQLEMNVCEQKVLRHFEKILLQEIGYGLQLKYVVEHLDTLKKYGAEVDPECYYLFDPEQGPIHVISNNRFRLGQSKDNNRIFKGSSLIALDQNKLDDPRALLDAKRIMRQALSLRLGPKPLESRRLLVI